MSTKLNTFFRAIVLLLAASLLHTCQPELGFNPDINIPEDRALEDQASIQNALESMYGFIQSRHCLSGTMRLVPDIMADHHVLIDPSSDVADFYNREVSETNPLVDSSWHISYRAINQANNIIDAIENKDIASDNPDFQNRALAEAYSMRALLHFELVRLFAPQYSDAHRADPAIILRTSPTTDYSPKGLSTVEQVYTQIVSDLEKAISFGVPTTPYIETPQLRNAQVGRIDEDVSKAFLVKVLYQMGETDGLLRSYQLINEILGGESQPYDSIPFDIEQCLPEKYPYYYLPFSNTNNFLIGLYNTLGSNRGTAFTTRCIYEQGGESFFPL